jgi:hypothetical protein
MKNGFLIFCHNSREIDYSLLSLVSGSLAKKYLKIPGTLITDSSTVKWMKESNIYDLTLSIFENVIQVDRPKIDNKRILNDGLFEQTVPFINSNRFLAYDITPYEKTLLLDSDFLIFSDRLNSYWDVSDDVLISGRAQDFYYKDRLGYHDRYISDTGIKLNWATTVMFTKNEKCKSFFKLVESIKKNYNYYSDIYRFDNRQYRNDISFSLACHITDGFITRNINLPDILTTISKDTLYDVKDDGRLIFLTSSGLNGETIFSSVKDLDIHVMNKQSIIRNHKKILNLI